MNALVDDYETFCSETKLLPRDDYRLFVASCGHTIDMNARLKLYYHPANRQKSKYLGIYGDKVVKHIGLINNVVSCDLNQDGTLNIIEGEPNSDERERIKNAIQEQGLGPGFKFFLCSEMEETYFKKQTGGVRSVAYVDLGETLGGDENVPDSLAELAETLKAIPWPE